MEVSGRYSNPVRTLVDLRKLKAPLTARSSCSPVRGNLCQIQRRLRDPEIDDLIDAYRSGATVSQLATRYQIHRTTALALLKRYGIPRRGRVWSPDLNERAIRVYGEGCSCVAIARQMKVNPERSASIS